MAGNEDEIRRKEWKMNTTNFRRKRVEGNENMKRNGCVQTGKKKG